MTCVGENHLLLQVLFVLHRPHPLRARRRRDQKQHLFLPG
jgi:hypothetical protein